MAQLPPFDQRWIRAHVDGFMSVGGGVSLCSVCGIKDECDALAGLNFIKHSRGIATRVTTCPIYVPVISFKSAEGLARPFNTFRRGLGWARRIDVGKRVRMFDLSKRRLVGEGRVTQVISGPLGPLLNDHAQHNHLMSEVPPALANVALYNVLVKLYGKTYADPGEEYSVIYVEPNQDG